MSYASRASYRLWKARAAFLAAGILIVGGWVDPRKAVDYVDWALLLLVGSALGLSKAITNSGLAGYAGDAIRESGMSASVSLYVLYGFTAVRRTLQPFQRSLIFPRSLALMILCKTLRTWIWHRWLLICVVHDLRTR